MHRRSGLLIVLISISFLTSCNQPNDKASAELEANKEVVRQAAIHINSRNYEGLRTVIADDYLRHSQATPGLKVKSFDEFVTFLKDGAVSFPDDKAIFDTLVAEGDLVAFWGRYEGTNTGPGPFPPTGKPISVEMSGVHRIEDGKIAETWVIWDNVAMFSEIGIKMVPQVETP